MLSAPRIAAILLLFVCCADRLAEIDRTEFGFGSYVRIQALAFNSAALDSAVESAFSEMFRLDTLWSSFLDVGDVYRLNRTGGASVQPETQELVREALVVCRNTGGALDITVKPLLDVWGVTKGNRRIPDSAELAEAKELVDFRQVDLRGDSVVLSGGARIDLGAIAVGFAVDRAVEELKAHGVKQGLVDAGGDIRVFGDRVWRIGLRNPRGEDVIRVFSVQNRAVSTSGDYQKYFEVEGRRYHHIIDPATGFPADKCASVTMLAPTALEADAYATAIFVLGPDAGLKVVRERKETGAVVLVESGDSLVTCEAGRLE